MARKKGVKYWKKKADAAYSKWIRESNETKLGVQCYTCRKWYPVKKMHNGHYISRRINHLRYNDMNTHPQCIGCNMFKADHLVSYREHLVEDYGEDKVKWLESQRHTLKQFKAHELEEIYLKYKAKNETNKSTK